MEGEGIALHEAIITRGDIQGQPELEPFIMVPQNCALVHHPKCHLEGHTKAGQKIIVADIIDWETFDEVNAWLAVLSPLFRNKTLIYEAKSLIEEIHNGSKEN